jgi:hypothetical protein
MGIQMHERPDKWEEAHGECNGDGCSHILHRQAKQWRQGWLQTALHAITVLYMVTPTSQLLWTLFGHITQTRP